MTKVCIFWLGDAQGPDWRRSRLWVQYSVTGMGMYSVLFLKSFMVNLGSQLRDECHTFPSRRILPRLSPSSANMMWRTQCMVLRTALRLILTEYNSYLEENHSYKLQSHARQSQQVSQPGRPSQDMMSFWGNYIHLWYLGFLLTSQGYKFETLCLLPKPWAETSRDYIENRENEIVRNHAQYCSVVKTGIGKSTLILGGEVDASKSSTFDTCSS